MNGTVSLLPHMPICRPYGQIYGKMVLPIETEGTRWRSCLRHGATSRKVAGLIPDGVIGIFH